MGDVVDFREMRKMFIVLVIKFFDYYDFFRVKIVCNLVWLVVKVFGIENVLEEF